MKVLAVVCRFYPELGGLETLVLEVAKRLGSKSEVTVACFTTRPNLPSEELLGNVHVNRRFVRGARFSVPRQIQWRFISLVDKVIRQKTSLAKPLGLLSQIFAPSSYVPCSGLAASRWLLREVIAENPDLIHVFDPRTAVILYPVVLATRRPVVVTFPGTSWNDSIKARAYDKLCYSMDYDWYVVHDDGRGAADNAKMMRVRRVSSFLAGVDTDFFDPNKVSRKEGRKMFGIKQGEFVFGMLGRIDSEKGTKEAVAAFLDIADNTTTLLVAGEVGAKRQYYEDLLNEVNSNSRGNRIAFLGPLDQSRIPYFLAACDALVFSARISNFHLTFAQSLAMGRLCIVGEQGMKTAREKLGSCPAILFHDGTVPDLERTMQAAIISHLRGDFSIEARELAKDMFDWDKVVCEIERSYSKVLESHRLSDSPPKVA